MKLQWIFCCLMFAAASVSAEPYFAVREGQKCMSCHVNPSGGGMRNAYGNAWAQTALPAHRIDIPGADLWTGSINSMISVGANLRAGYAYTDQPHTAPQSEFDVEELRVYGAVNLIAGRLMLYADERVAPGGSLNLESYARLTSEDQRWYVKAGQMYLPYGWRLEDDTAFVRTQTGINFATPDKGVEVGFEGGPWTAQLALTNGTAGGSENNRGKQLSLRAERVQSMWRLGASFNFNDSEAGNRQMQGLFAGLRTGPIAWLAEGDYIIDDSFPEQRKQWVGLLEADWKFAPGQNLKITSEYFEPDTEVNEDEQARYSLVWEYVPFQFLQLRTGARIYDGIPQSDVQNRQRYFVSINGFF